MSKNDQDFESLLFLVFASRYNSWFSFRRSRLSERRSSADSRSPKVEKTGQGTVAGNVTAAQSPSILAKATTRRSSVRLSVDRQSEGQSVSQSTTASPKIGSKIPENIKPTDKDKSQEKNGNGSDSGTRDLRKREKKENVTEKQTDVPETGDKQNTKISDIKNGKQNQEAINSPLRRVSRNRGRQSSVDKPQLSDDSQFTRLIVSKKNSNREKPESKDEKTAFDVTDHNVAMETDQLVATATEDGSVAVETCVDAASKSSTLIPNDAASKSSNKKPAAVNISKSSVTEVDEKTSESQNEAGKDKKSPPGDKTNSDPETVEVSLLNIKALWRQPRNIYI